MFKRTFTLWRRLVGSRPRRPISNDDRRVWIRFPANLETTFRPADADGGARLSALVRDISRGGLSLAADRAFAPGNLLAVELPGPAEEAICSVLACVVHVTPQGAGNWILGCSFSRELSDADLAHFGARRSHSSNGDQRSWDRYDCDMRAVYQAPTAPHLGPREATVLNISASGVGLLVDQAIDNGTLLSVELHSPEGGLSKTILACVVHVKQQGESAWALGCNFITELSEAELLALV
jgi:hypothetical protein